MSTERLRTYFEVDQPLLIFSSISAGVSFTIFILSMLDLGYMSLFINPIVTGLTIVFHIIYFITARRQRDRPKTMIGIPPHYSIAYVTYGCCLVVVWLGAAILTLYQSVVLGPHSQVVPIVSGYVKGNLGVVVAQAVLSVVNFVLVVWVTMGLFFGRSRCLKQNEARLLKPGVVA